MRYIIVTRDHTVTGQPFASYDEAIAAAASTFGEDIHTWLDLNLRIEEQR